MKKSFQPKILQNFFSNFRNIGNILGIPKRLSIFLKFEKKFCKRSSPGDDPDLPKKLCDKTYISLVYTT